MGGSANRQACTTKTPGTIFHVAINVLLLAIFFHNNSPADAQRQVPAFSSVSSSPPFPAVPAPNINPQGFVVPVPAAGPVTYKKGGAGKQGGKMTVGKLAKGQEPLPYHYDKEVGHAGFPPPNMPIYRSLNDGRSEKVEIVMCVPEEEEGFLSHVLQC